MKLWIGFLGLIPLSGFAFEAPQWKTELVDAVCSGSRTVEIEFDRKGDIYLGFTGCGYETDEKKEKQLPSVQINPSVLKIAKRSSQEWELETIDTSSIDTGRHPNISFDAKNGMHVVYADHESWRMKYAYRAAGKTTFDIQSIGSEIGGYWVSGHLIGDTLYATHTRFENERYETPRLELVTIKNGKAKTELVQRFDGGWNTFITGNETSGPVIASMAGYSGFRGDFMISRLVKGKWVYETVDSVTTKPEVAVDSLGFLHVTYTKQDPTNTKLDNVAYATNSPDGIWKGEIIAGDESEDADAIFSTIAIDHNNGVHIAYKNYRDRWLMYKRKLSGGQWETYKIDDRGNPIYSRLKVDAQNRLHIAYEKSENIFYGVCEGCTKN